MSELFGQLAEFSARVFDSWGLPSRCEWEGPWEHAGPRGILAHYTRGQQLRSAAKWAMDPKFEAKASAHVLVAAQKIEAFAPLERGLPLVKALPVTVLQCVPPTRAAWHATWCNGLCYGIENINAGLLQPHVRDGYRYGAQGQHVYQQWREPVRLLGRWWEPYTRGQVEANIILAREVLALYPDSIRRPWVLGHEQVQGPDTPGSSRRDKRDPGPAYPLPALIEGVAEASTPLEDLLGLAHWATDTRYAESVADGVVLDYWPGPPVSAWLAFEGALKGWPEAENGRSMNVLEAGLRLLGYDVEADLAQSVWIFSRMMGLNGDSKGISTEFKQALIKRLKDRNFLALGFGK